MQRAPSGQRPPPARGLRPALRDGAPGLKRTHLPLTGLRVLDAAARHLSFTRAADELAVTPAAVGQQVRALEDTLGVVLFRRTTRGLELTPEAENGLAALRDGFLQFEEAVRAMQAGQSSKSLTIAAPRDLTEKWLMPRLAAIARTDRELRFVLIAADEPPDFTEANLDLAIRWGEGPGGLEGEALESEGLVAVAAPGAGAEVVAIGWPGSPAAAGPGRRRGAGDRRGGAGAGPRDGARAARARTARRRAGGGAGRADAVAAGLLADRAAAAMAPEEGARAGGCADGVSGGGGNGPREPARLPHPTRSVRAELVEAHEPCATPATCPSTSSG